MTSWQGYEKRDVGSIAIPALGSGLGGLNWPDVQSRIKAALAELTAVNVLVYEPADSSLRKISTKSTDVPPKMTEAERHS